MSRSGRAVIAILSAVVAVLFAQWLDGRVIGDILVRARATFDSAGYTWAMSLGTLAMVALVLGLGVLAWRSRSALVGGVYAVAGAFLVFVPVLVRLFATQVNDTPPLLPEPIAVALSDVWTWSTGPLNAVATIGGGMFVVGILVAGRSLLGRTAGRASEPLPAIDAQMIHP